MSQPLSPTKMLVIAMVATNVASLTPSVAFAQTAPGTESPIGMRATSPLVSRSTRPGGIPLGSTEIATPGLAPVTRAQGGCAAPANATSPGALFDGGGLSAGTALSCSDERLPPSVLPSPSSVGRVGIPLGATETGGAGISRSVEVPGPFLFPATPIPPHATAE